MDFKVELLEALFAMLDEFTISEVGLEVLCGLEAQRLRVTMSAKLGRGEWFDRHLQSPG